MKALHWNKSATHLVSLGFKSNFTWKTTGNSKTDSEIGLVLVIANVSVITGSGVGHGTRVVTNPSAALPVAVVDLCHRETGE